MKVGMMELFVFDRHLVANMTNTPLPFTYSHFAVFLLLDCSNDINSGDILICVVCGMKHN